MKKTYWIAILGGIAVALAAVLIVVAAVSNRERKKDGSAPEDFPITNVTDPAGTSVEKNSTELLPEQGVDRKENPQAEKPSIPQVGNHDPEPAEPKPANPADPEPADSGPIELPFLPYEG